MDPDRTGDADAAGLQRERDLYLRLLELGHQTTLAPFLQQALALLVDLTAAKEAYLELYDDEDRPEGPRWWTGRGLAGARLGAGLPAAKEAYLELYDDEDRPEGPRWWTARGLSGDRIGDVRATISRGIIAEAVASGRTVINPAARL